MQIALIRVIINWYEHVRATQTCLQFVLITFAKVHNQHPVKNKYILSLTATCLQQSVKTNILTIYLHMYIFLLQVWMLKKAFSNTQGNRLSFCGLLTFYIFCKFNSEPPNLLSHKLFRWTVFQVFSLLRKYLNNQRK